MKLVEVEQSFGPPPVEIEGRVFQYFLPSINWRLCHMSCSYSDPRKPLAVQSFPMNLKLDFETISDLHIPNKPRNVIFFERQSRSLIKSWPVLPKIQFPEDWVRAENVLILGKYWLSIPEYLTDIRMQISISVSSERSHSTAWTLSMCIGVRPDMASETGNVDWGFDIPTVEISRYSLGWKVKTKVLMFVRFVQSRYIIYIDRGSLFQELIYFHIQPIWFLNDNVDYLHL